MIRNNNIYILSITACLLASHTTFGMFFWGESEQQKKARKAELESLLEMTRQESAKKILTHREDIFAPEENLFKDDLAEQVSVLNPKTKKYETVTLKEARTMWNHASLPVQHNDNLPLDTRRMKYWFDPKNEKIPAKTYAHWFCELWTSAFGARKKKEDFSNKQNYIASQSNMLAKYITKDPIDIDNATKHWQEILKKDAIDCKSQQERYLNSLAQNEEKMNVPHIQEKFAIDVVHNPYYGTEQAQFLYAIDAHKKADSNKKLYRTFSSKLTGKVTVTRLDEKGNPQYTFVLSKDAYDIIEQNRSTVPAARLNSSGVE